MSGQGFKDDVSEGFRECVELRARVKELEGKNATLHAALAWLHDEVKDTYKDAEHAARSFDPAARRVLSGLHEIRSTARAILAQTAPDATP